MQRPTHISLECPYCSQDIEVCAPDGIDPAIRPMEVECLPYTRDIGRFDPKPGEDALGPQLWSRIGKDYLSWLNYDRLVGILRTERPGINVQYRVQKCPACHELFDVFANYTQGQTFQDLWPHLFTKEGSGGEDNEAGIKLYQGENAALRLIRAVGKVAKSDYIGILAVGLFIFLSGCLPYILLGNRIDPGFRLAAWAAQQFPTTEPAELLRTVSMVFYGMIAVSLMVVLALYNNYVRFLRNSSEFDELFRLMKPGIGVVFWKNYTSSRCTGVQSPRSRFPRITQSDVYAGGIAIVLALIMWFWKEAGNPLARLQPGQPLILLFEVWELLTWLVILYFLALAIFLAMGLTFYVLNGVRKIPMNISPLDHFRTAKPLRTMESYSVRILLAAFVQVLLTLAALQLFMNLPWVVAWFQYAVAWLFGTLGFGLGVSEYLVGALVYLGLLYLIPSTPPQGTEITLNASLITLGVFFTFITAFHLALANRYVNQVLDRSKDEAIREQKEQLERLEAELKQLNARIAELSSGTVPRSSMEMVSSLRAQRQPAVGHPSMELMTGLRAQRQSVYESITSVVSMIERLEKEDIPNNVARRILEIATPLVSSFVIQPLLQKVSDLAFKSLGVG